MLRDIHARFFRAMAARENSLSSGYMALAGIVGRSETAEMRTSKLITFEMNIHFVVKLKCEYIDLFA